MKQISLLGLCALMAAMIVSCKSNNEEEKSKTATPQPYEMGVAFLQLTQDEYRNYVLADPYYEPVDTTVDKNNYHMTGYYLRSRYDNVVCQECYLGTNPYIDLGEGWLATDWKWGDFFYPYTNVLLSVPWTNIKDSWQVWDLNTPIITKSHTIRYGYAWRKAIDNYLGIQPAPMDTTTWTYHNGLKFNISADYLKPSFLLANRGQCKTIDEIPDTLFIDEMGYAYTKEMYLREVARQDSLQQVYVERLRTIIQSGKLEELCTVYFVADYIDE